MAIALQPRAWLERRRARRDADRWIARGFESRFPWRVTELTSERERRRSARAVHGVLSEIDGAKLPGATPLRGRALRPHRELLEAIEQRLGDGRPVSGRGMVAVEALLTRPDSCLFAEVDDVAAVLRTVLTSLEVR